MAIQKAHSFLTHPAKARETKPIIRGAAVPAGNPLYDMLSDVLAKSSTECNIDISFNAIDGKQENPSRSLIIEYIETPTLAKGRKIAEALQAVTTNRSGMGLLFLVLATDGSKKRLLLSRFPADVGVLAEELGDELSVEFVEKVFMKGANSYKSVVYQDVSTQKGFWDGRATDKQINNSDITISDYWIREFLLSDFKTTSEAGTRRMAVAMRNAIQNTGNIDVKSEIASAAQLVQTLPRQTTSIVAICSRFNFSGATQEAIVKELPNANSATEKFLFSSAEFGRHIQYRSIELDNGGRVVADAARFEKIFIVSRDGDDGSVNISTKGKVVDDRLRKSK